MKSAIAILLLTLASSALASEPMPDSKVMGSWICTHQGETIEEVLRDADSFTMLKIEKLSESEVRVWVGTEMQDYSLDRETPSGTALMGDSYLLTSRRATGTAPKLSQHFIVSAKEDGRLRYIARIPGQKLSAYVCTAVYTK